MCIAPKVKTPPPPPPPPAAPPPPEKPPEALEDAIDSNATGLKKKKMGARGRLGRGKSGVQTKGSAAGAGLKIGGGQY
tara:strand:+ start:1040 stop:1273 length:234 start_codon:yes stop_codon:yes gene_type:complete